MVNDVVLVYTASVIIWIYFTCDTWREVVQKDCQARNLNREDAMDRGRWKKLIMTG